MKKLLLVILSIVTFGFTNAQNCLPDSSYLGTGAGLFPLPDSTINNGGQDPTLGITEAAYENCFF